MTKRAFRFRLRRVSGRRDIECFSCGTHYSPATGELAKKRGYEYWAKNPDIKTGKIIGYLCRTCYLTLVVNWSRNPGGRLLGERRKGSSTRMLTRYYCKQCKRYMEEFIAKQHREMFIAHTLVRIMLPKDQVRMMEEKRKLQQYQLQWNPIPALA